MQVKKLPRNDARRRVVQYTQGGKLFINREADIPLLDHISFTPSNKKDGESRSCFFVRSQDPSIHKNSTIKLSSNLEIGLVGPDKTLSSNPPLVLYIVYSDRYYVTEFGSFDDVLLISDLHFYDKERFKFLKSILRKLGIPDFKIIRDYDTFLNSQISYLQQTLASHRETLIKYKNRDCRFLIVVLGDIGSKSTDVSLWIKCLMQIAQPHDAFLLVSGDNEGLDENLKFLHSFRPYFAHHAILILRSEDLNVRTVLPHTFFLHLTHRPTSFIIVTSDRESHKVPNIHGHSHIEQEQQIEEILSQVMLGAIDVRQAKIPEVWFNKRQINVDWTYHVRTLGFARLSAILYALGYIVLDEVKSFDQDVYLDPLGLREYID
ncbi:MAG: hypothetical protein N3E37_02980 [Candidatus Micrarchaeota archaeon]|nr:hypothetical protein [Candidatus Micrarchaeota archaeon]